MSSLAHAAPTKRAPGRRRSRAAGHRSRVREPALDRARGNRSSCRRPKRTGCAWPRTSAGSVPGDTPRLETVELAHVERDAARRFLRDVHEPLAVGRDHDVGAADIRQRRRRRWRHDEARHGQWERWRRDGRSRGARNRRSQRSRCRARPPRAARVARASRYDPSERSAARLSNVPSSARRTSRMSAMRFLGSFLRHSSIVVRTLGATLCGSALKSGSRSSTRASVDDTSSPRNAA